MSAVAGTPLADKVFGSFRPLRVKEPEARGQQAAGNDTAAFQDKLGFCAQEPRGKLENRSWRGHSIGSVPCLA